MLLRSDVPIPTQHRSSTDLNYFLIELKACIHKYRCALSDSEQWPAVALHDVIRQYSGSLKLRVPFICRELGSSLRTVQRMFHARYGQTIREYQTAERLYYSIQQLRTGSDEKIAFIAHVCGYRSASDFSVFFRKHTGLTPSQYRLRVRRRETAAQNGSDDSAQ